MKLVQLSTLLALPVLLTGCGGSEGGSGGGKSTPPVPQYTVNFLALSLKDANSTGSCAIYGQDSTAAPTRNVVAAKAIGQNISLHIHNDEGKRLSSYDATDWANGSFSFEQSTVPAGGYISIVATNTAGLHTGYDVLTIEKSLIPTNFSVNAKGETSSAACITQAAAARPTNYIAYISDDGDPNDGLFAVHSTTEEIQSASQNNINYSSYSGKEVLAARFCRTGSSGCEVGQLLKYSFVQAGSGNNINAAIQLEDVQDPSALWKPNSDATISKAELNIYRNGTGAIKWQDLTTNTDSRYSYASGIEDSYYLSINGTHKQWQFAYSDNVANPSSGIDQSNTLTDLSIPSPNSAAKDLSSCGTSELGLCANGYNSSAPAELNIQRTLIAVANATHSISQTIYAPSNQMQPLMKFDNGIDALWGSTLSKFEVSLFANAGNASLDYTFLTRFFSAYSVVSNNYSNQSYTDTLSVIEKQRTRQENENSLLYKDYKIFDSKL